MSIKNIYNFNFNNILKYKYGNNRQRIR